MKENKLILTGGHAGTTAIAVVEEIKKRYPNWQLYWVGPKSAVEGKSVPTLASSIFPSMEVKFIPLTTGRLQKKFTIYTIPSLFKIPLGIINSMKIILNIKPQLVVSFGGFASVPVCFVAWILNIPVITHEQTVAVGRANKINAFFAKKVLVARSESKKFLPEKKTILVGNPVSKAIATMKPKTVLSKIPTLYITGGSSGAQRINSVIKDCLFDLLKKYKLIHQTGILDYKEFKKLKDSFPLDLKNRYEVHDFINPKIIPSIFAKSDIVISRAGANTISEIMITNTPCILIPIPWTAYNEQVLNAQMVVKTGLAQIIEEKDLTPTNLLTTLDNITKNWLNIVKKTDSSLANLDKRAAEKFVDEIQSLLPDTIKR